MRAFPAAPRRFALAAFFCLLAGWPVTNLRADDDDDYAAQQSAIRAAVARGEILPLPRLMALALRRVPGEIIEIEFDKDDLSYEFKILSPKGQVWEVEIDARNGAIIDMEDD